MGTVTSRSARLLRGGLALAALIAFVAAFFGQDTAQASTFAPKASACVDNADTVDPNPFEPGDAGECDGDSSTGANSDITTTFGMDAPDSNFGAVISFTPPEFGVAKDADVPDFALVGNLTSLATLGLLNAPCWTQLVVDFDFLDAVTDMSVTTTFEEQFNDDDNDGVPNGAEMYPDFLTRISALAGQQPIARLYGQNTTAVPGTPVSLNFLIFAPGTTVGIPLDPALGYPSVTVLQNMGDPAVAPAPGSITDFCSPLKTTTTTFGLTKDNPNTATNEAGTAYRTNPTADGGYNFVTFTQSLRDADNDGMENSLDTCPYSADPGFDPRVAIATMPDPTTDDDPNAFGIPTGDGIPRSCDPTPDQDRGLGDDDFDLYMNRGDNCPTVANGQAEDNQKDSDGDSIGDACDRNPNTPDGHIHIVCEVSVVNIGAGGTPAIDPLTKVPCAADSDGDGVGDADELSFGSDPADPNSTPEHSDFDAATCSDGVDNDGDGQTDLDDPGCAALVAPTATPSPEATATPTPAPTPTPTATPRAALPRMGGPPGDQSSGMNTALVLGIAGAALIAVGGAGAYRYVVVRRRR